MATPSADRSARWMLWNPSTKAASAVTGKHLRSGHFLGARRPRLVKRSDGQCAGGCGRRAKLSGALCTTCSRLRNYGWADILLYRARSDAPKRGLVVTATVDDILSIRPEQGGADYWAPGCIDFDNSGSDHFPSLDRFDNNRGYEPDNIVLTTWPVNRMRNDMDPIRFINFLYAKRMTTKAHVQKVYQRVQQMKLPFPKEEKEKAA